MPDHTAGKCTTGNWARTGLWALGGYGAVAGAWLALAARRLPSDAPSAQARSGAAR